MWVRKGMAGEQGPQEERWAVQGAGWGGGVSLGRGRAIPPLSWVRGGKKKGQAEGQLVCSSNGLDFLGVIDQRPREMLRVHSLKAALGEIGREVSLEAWRGSWASGIGGPLAFWGPCSLLRGFLQQGLGGWGRCVEGDGRLGYFILFF